jgi:protocatechuate 3,4-dioxygenase beta subunit
MLRGRVLDIAGAPVTGARLDFWQADATGRYDNQGFRLRGHQRTDASGRYTLETVVPGAYYLRPPHIHVKLAAPRRATLTTQLYFPGEALNQSDSFYDPTLLVRMRDDADGKEASFDFVLR